jgi:hypothetical protein
MNRKLEKEFDELARKKNLNKKIVEKKIMKELEKAAERIINES